jgi:hypothetical protein
MRRYFAERGSKIVVAEFGAAHSYLTGPRIEHQGLGGGLYVFFTAIAEGWRGPFLFTRLILQAKYRGDFNVVPICLGGRVLPRRWTSASALETNSFLRFKSVGI